MSPYTATWKRSQPDKVTVTGPPRPLAYPVRQPRTDGSVDRYCERYDGSQGPFLAMMTQTPWAVIPGSRWQRAGQGAWTADVYPRSPEFAESLERMAARTQ